MRTLKRFLKICMLLVVLWAAVWQWLSVFVSLRGKPMLAGKLSELCGAPASIDSIEVSPFLTFTARGIEAGTLFAAESVVIQPDVRGLLFGKIVIEGVEIMRPRMVFVPGQQHAQEPSGRGARQMPAVVLRHVRIRHGDIAIVDRSMGTGFDYRFADVELLAVLKDGLIDFELQAEFMPGKDPRPASLLATGWLNWPERDMEARIVFKDVELLDFSPYFSRYIEVGKSGIESTRCDLNGDVRGLDNAVTAICRMECSSVVFKDLTKRETPDRARMLAELAVEALKQGAGSNGMPFLDFSFTTAMDRPHLPIGAAIGAAFENKLKRTVSIEPFNLRAVSQLPGRIFTETYNSVRGLTRGSFDPAIKSGVDLRNAFAETFYKIKVGPEKK